MQRIIGIAVVAVGILLLVLGLRAMDSLASQFSRFFSGTPTDRAVWLTIAGVVGIVVGAAAVLLPPRLAGGSRAGR